MILKLTRKLVGADITVLVLEGRLTLGQGSLQLEDLIRGLAEEGIRKVVLDLGGLTYMDSAGMGAIAKSAVTLVQVGGTLRLAGAGERVASALSITQLDRIVSLFPDLDSALRAF